MAEATLTISSRNYSSWSLRGWLLCRMAGLDVAVEVLGGGDAASRAELLHLSPSFLVPRLIHGPVRVWDVMAIAQYLDEWRPEAGLVPADRIQRAWCRSIAGEMHGGFINLRSALPMNLRARYTDFKLWGGAQSDIARIVEIWEEALGAHGGPFLFGERPTVADAMYAPVCTRFVTYGVGLPARSAAFRDHVMAWAPMQEWIAEAEGEPDEIEELDMEF
ncbi:MAG: glutathione S-transferase family protein [Methylobacterium sp.]|jgi:glutathione S-transferase|uniref:glutathione S-transferase family protein n=1 Tax=Methylobacterium sp. TaxID=409 RepID=UPI002585AE7F|nr:glutathione S-transferase family protein [Methylobacterium sp.]MBY0295750.1 glutathione S-transferase family protein [Methylobacterium sp.]